MLDLKSLESQLDEVLSKETSETMTSWLYSRRVKKYIASLGEGEFQILTFDKININQQKEHQISNHAREFINEYNLETDFCFAA